MKNLNYFLYMAEVEGINTITSTRLTKLNKIVKDFIIFARRGFDIEDPHIQDIILEANDLEDITEKEAQYVARKVRKNF